MYFKENNPPGEFKISDGTSSHASLIDKLIELLLDIENRKVRKIEFYEDLVDNNGRMKYNLVDLKTYKDMTTMSK